MLDNPKVVIHDRSLFMQQAYTALFTGAVQELPCAAKQQVVAEVTRDLMGVIKSMTPDGYEYLPAIDELRAQLLSATRPN